MIIGWIDAFIVCTIDSSDSLLLRVFIRCIHPVQLENPPSAHLTIHVDRAFISVYRIPRRLHCCFFISTDGVLFFTFHSFCMLVLIEISSMGPIMNATKTCSVIMVSSIDHVVMNHQNHTRTNDLMYGHVGYNDYQRNQHVACPQQQCDTMWAQRTKL
jgi:hypothetical protein